MGSEDKKDKKDKDKKDKDKKKEGSKDKDKKKEKKGSKDKDKKKDKKKDKNDWCLTNFVKLSLNNNIFITVCVTAPLFLTQWLLF